MAGAVGRAVAGGAARVIPAVAKQVVKTPFRAATALRLASKADAKGRDEMNSDDDGEDGYDYKQYSHANKDILGRPPS